MENATLKRTNDYTHRSYYKRREAVAASGDVSNAMELSYLLFACTDPDVPTRTDAIKALRQFDCEISKELGVVLNYIERSQNKRLTQSVMPPPKANREV